MAPIAATQADAIRSAVTSAATCTPATSAALKDLLQGNDNNNTTKSLPNSTLRNTTQVPSKTRPPTAKKQTKTAAAQDRGNGLSPKEKAALAVQVINATLKALGEAAKASPPVEPTTWPAAKKTQAKSTTRTALRRSVSAPNTPLHPRPLNRVLTSPATAKPSQAPSAGACNGCLALLECTRVAFTTLRTLQATGAVQLPDLQLESGMSSLVNKLIMLKMYDQAVKDLRVLKKRLECLISGSSSKKSDASTTNTSCTPKTFSDLLDYPATAPSGSLCGFVITAQLQALQILHGLKKLSHLEATLPFLRNTHSSSPLNLLISSLDDEKTDRVKVARQLDTLSQILLSLTPSLAQKDDGVACEPRLSPKPSSALEIQALGLVARLESWHISGHKGDAGKEILIPLSVCLTAGKRRISCEESSILEVVFEQIWSKIGTQRLGISESNATLTTIYQLLAGAAQDSGRHKDAKQWTVRLMSLVNPHQGSATKSCAVTAQLLTLSLRDSLEVDEGLMSQVLEGIQGNLSGSTSELNDLLTSIHNLRKVVINIITKHPISTPDALHSARELLEKFIFQLPRFACRWLGKPPDLSAATKDRVRFEQRRQLLASCHKSWLDSTLTLTKLHLDEDRSTWDVADSTLQESLILLEYMGGASSMDVERHPASSYRVKISHLYYQQYLILQKSKANDQGAASLRALRKSIDCVKMQSEPEQAKAQLLFKWEKFVELCKASGRKDYAIEALRSLRDHLVRHEVVDAITASLESQSIAKSWHLNIEAEILSRTVCNLARLDKKQSDWTWLLSGKNKATALEHDLYFISDSNTASQQNKWLVEASSDKLLQSYSVGNHPIRRLRVLLVLLISNIGVRDVLERLRGEIETVSLALEGGHFEDDSGLKRYLPHLRNLSTCALSLVNGEVEPSTIQRAISGWKGILAGCSSATQLGDYIDDVPRMLKVLTSLADLARMKGLQNLLTEIIELSVVISRTTINDNFELYVTHSTALSLHCLSLGRTTRAEKVLTAVMEEAILPNVSGDVVSFLHLSAAEFYLATEHFDKVEEHLSKACELATESSTRSVKKSHRVFNKIAVAQASFLTSTMALERGEDHRALQLAKAAVNMLFHDWQQLQLCLSSSADTSMEVTQVNISEEEQSLSDSMVGLDVVRTSTGPEFWALVYPLYRFVSRLSSTYAHIGMYQETIYYAEQARKVAESMGSSAFIAEATMWLASVSLMAGQVIKSKELFTESESVLLAAEPTYSIATALCRAASVYQGVDEVQNAEELISKADSMLKALERYSEDEDKSVEKDLEDGIANLKISEASVAVPTSKPPRVSKRTIVKKVPTKEKQDARKIVPINRKEDAQLKSLYASILRLQSLTLLGNEHWSEAIAALQSAAHLSAMSSGLLQEHLYLGQSLIGKSLQQMGSDSVFSFIQDSTLSFPSVAAAARDKGPTSLSASLKISPVGKHRFVFQEGRSFVENLQNAQKHLLKAHSIAMLSGNGAIVHRIAAALQNVAILLLNTNCSNSGTGLPAYATCSVELARNITWRRERKANREVITRNSKTVWPAVFESTNTRRSSLDLSPDLNRFHKEYIDDIPKAWNVLSVSLSENKNDLCITKLQAGFSPFALRLPLGRANSRDADTEIFDFQQGRSELIDIIQMANRNCHDARDMTQTESKSRWWAEREELDGRLKQLLDNINETWLGGFRGIFSQHRKRPDLLARFQKTFQNILEKYLPSRRPARGKKLKTASPKVNLDSRILDLFIGLGDATEPDCDLDEALTDLLYFVVDVLQFHGEPNAYDEVDFDAMVIDTFDALHSYHSTARDARPTGDEEWSPHTILILDKCLHIFPWESLPCLLGNPVSRVPSLDCLRRSILESRAPRLATPSTTSGPGGADKRMVSGFRAGHHVSINSGTYILNPGADLTNTQATFGRPLSSLPPAWSSIETREPSEQEFQSALTDRDILLYFGHGSGAQYIRSRTIRRLEKCRTTALLMGCSSASLTHAGDFEPYGPVWNYMLAGAPAVVGTLWDVTDRDIDRFTGCVFEGWGLLPHGTFCEERGKGKARSKTTGGRKKAKVSEEKTMALSLIEAVAKARIDTCRFKYLTAAAVCVYGIPVYISE
ncbi:peptidase family C50-domain-containing protein [Xylariaceae sp. FL1272]|nr:peptidase family C50-domain-containing protein [Xylariaceae sp. FL1272]